MASLKGSKTEKNLQLALAGESIARNKYTYFAQKAREENKEETAKLFERMAQNESTHAKQWFEMLNGSIHDTNTNLQLAMSGENSEWMHMYPDFAKDAEAEGFPAAAEMFRKIANIEMLHEKQFMEEFIRLNSSSASNKGTTIEGKAPVAAWRCGFCGHAIPADSKEPPVVCPVCQAIGAYEHVTMQL